MDENKQVGPSHGRSVFDNLMFGPTRRPTSLEVTKDDDPQNATKDFEANLETTKLEDKNLSKPENMTEKNNNETNPQAPELDFVQMMQQFDMLMDYANKLGPSLKKMGPLFDLFKGKK
ncbi:hypothetical protein DS745_18165 [Anaerobacillus alkaliphilus]|uniref:Uncharacterized protein n=1 Tax=Anaerobacillus alkaliphilus TaxID=1548597 RepID=A0A4Q0VQ72_9BACI|nr:hypothetical protein [Anaerobacillus alkaliphilus]RXI98261.1 hypothetical protein DS745_18165 [Anaerobacillus alkaliphilus]